ncbi:MAG: CHAT domain-containing protein, partial [Candidatus Helarchaeota archaeon]
VPLNNIGKVYLQWSQFDEALKYLSRGLEVAESVGNQRDIAISLNSVGLVYRTWGKYAEAIEHYQQAIKIQEEINDPHQKGTSINNLGECYIYQKQLDQALKNFKKAQRVFEQVQDPRGISISINNIALVQQMQGSFQEAIEGYQEALEIAEELGDIHSTAVAYNNIALVYQAKEEYEKSIEYLEKGIDIYRKLGDLNRESLAITNLGFSKWFQKNYQEALDLFIQAIDLQEGLTGKLKSEDVRISYRATQLGPYEAITEMLLDWYMQDGDESHLQDGLKFLELSKAREIVDKLESGRVRIETCPELHKLIDLEQKLVYEISQLEDMTASERRQGKVRSITLSELEEKGARLKEIRAELMEKCKDPGLTRVTKEYNPIPDFQELFKQEDVVIWEFLYFPNWWVYKNQFRILVWDANSIRVYNSNEFDKDALETLNKEFHEKIALNTMKDTELAMKKLEELQKNLGQLLPDDLYLTLENKKKLILIPHEVLHIFPWEIIERIGLKLPCVRSYSLGLLRSCMKRELLTKNILLIANPNYNIKELDLPGADLEVRSIKKVLKKGGRKSEILNHKEAVEKAFEDLVKQEFGIIHFAGHGVYDPTNRDPWMSGLLFYRSDGYDMRTVTEIVGQRFNGAPLFILSACDTGRSKFSQGDEMVGLIRGLTLAGATSIIATNWLLSDLVA